MAARYRAVERTAVTMIVILDLLDLLNAELSPKRE